MSSSSFNGRHLTHASTELRRRGKGQPAEILQKNRAVTLRFDQEKNVCVHGAREKFSLQIRRCKTARKPSHQKGPRSEHATVRSVRTGKRAAVVRTMQD